MRFDPTAAAARLARLIGLARPLLRRTIAVLTRLADVLDRIADDGPAAPRR